MATGAVIARILSQYSDKGSKAAQKDIAKLGKKIDAFGKKATKSFAVAAAASGALAVKIGKDSVKAAIEDNKSQAALAKTLYATVGATDSVVASVEEYIGKQQMLANVSDTELRASFAKLVMSSGSVESAMAEQTLALDIAAGTGKDLALVSDAIAKAQQGNFAALKKVIPTLDANIVKNKDLGAALLFANKQFQGQAEAAANTDPLKKLSLAYGELQEKLGNALLPSVVLFVDYLVNRVFPQLEYWIYLNENRLSGALDAVVGNIKEIVVAFTNIYNIIEGINDLLPIGIGGWIQLAVAIKALTLVAQIGNTALAVYSMRLSLLTGTMQIFGKSTDSVKTILGSSANNQMKMILLAEKLKLALLGTAAAGTKLGIALRFIGKMMLAILPKPIWLLFAAIAAVAVVAKKVFKVGDGKNVLSDQAQAAEYSMWKAAKATESMDDALNKYRTTQEKKINKTKDEIEYEKLLAAQKAKSLKEDKLKAKFEADYAKLNKTLAARAGVKLLSSDDEKLVQINAAIALNARQEKLDTINLSLLKTLKEEVLLLKVKNDLSERYNDILKVLALSDDKLPGAIAVLAQKWGTTTEAVKAYILQFQIVSDGMVDDKEVIKLAQSWGSTKEQAAKYLDFFIALNDGVLDAREIDKLKSKWSMTEAQVKQYADFVGVVNDGKLEDKEVQKLMDKWKLTSDQVVAYIKQIGSPVSYNGSMLTTAQAAELAWKNALAALEAFLAKQATAAIGATSSSSSSSSSAAAASAVTPKAGDPAVTAETIAAAVSAISTATTTKTINAAVAAATVAGVSASEIANSMVTGLLGQGVSTQNALSSARYTGQAIAAQQKAEQDAAELALRNQQYAEGMAKRYGGYVGTSSTMDTSKSLMAGGINSGGNTTVNLTVNGSVTTEADLVATVRSGLLRGQYNGQSLTLEAI